MEVEEKEKKIIITNEIKKFSDVNTRWIKIRFVFIAC